MPCSSSVRNVTVFTIPWLENDVHQLILPQSAGLHGPKTTRPQQEFLLRPQVPLLLFGWRSASPSEATPSKNSAGELVMRTIASPVAAIIKLFAGQNFLTFRRLQVETGFPLSGMTCALSSTTA
jgi:hypothetical protein